MIDVSELVFTYPNGDAPTLRGLSFQIEDGEIFGFLGPSGAGKSTTQKLIIGLLKGYRGSVQVLGRELRGWGSSYYEHIGVGFELPNHYTKLTAEENLNAFRALYAGETEEPRELLEQVGLGDAAKTRVEDFSKGMKMRLNFCRAVLNRPRLLFLDEPTSGLDPVNARRIRGLIQARREAGMTVFLTTHNMAVADALCDRVAFIADGELAAVDSPSKLKLEHGERKVRVTTQGGEREFGLDGLGEDAGFLELIRTQRIETIHSAEPTLEDVFIRVTGQQLRAA